MATGSSAAFRGASPWFLVLAALWAVGTALQVVSLARGDGSLGVTLEPDADGVARVVAVAEDADPEGLRVGDRLLRIDGREAAVPEGTWQRIWAVADAWSAPVPLRVERDGREFALDQPPLSRAPDKLPYLLMGAMCGLTGLWIGRRGFHSGAPRPMGEALMAGGAAMLGPIGSPLAAAISFLCTAVAHGALGPLAVRGMLALSPRAEPFGAWFRPAVGVLWLRGLTYPGSWYGLPGLPVDLEPALTALDRLLLGWMSVLVLVVSLRGFRFASRALRRRTALGALISTVCLTVYVLNLVAAGFGLPHVGPPWRELPFGLMPLGLLVSDLEEFDIERSVTGGMAAAVFATLGLGAAIAALPDLVGWVAGRTGLAAGPSVVIVAALAVGFGLPASKRAGPWVESLFFPGRAELRAGLDQLLRDLETCETRQEVSELLGVRLLTLLRPHTLAVYARGADGSWLPDFGVGASAPPLAADAMLPRELSARPGVLSLQRTDPLDRPGLLAGDRQLLRELDPALLLPLRRGRHLEGFVGIGARRSREVYSPSDLSVLSQVAEGASRVVAGFAQAEAQERAEALAREGEDRSRFLAAASHDLRQPLGALSLLVEGLGERSDDADTRALVERLRASVGDLRELFEGVLDVSKLEATGEQPQVSRFPLALLLERLRAELEPEARAGASELRFADTELTVESDPVLLRRILQNLLYNALKHAGEGRVELALRSQDGAVWIDVVDEGPGLSGEEIERAFEEWKRVPGPEAREVPGVGLGLSIVRRLAASLDHPLEVESTPGRGSRFSVRVPTAAPVARVAADPLAGLRVQVVGFDDAARGPLEASLRELGCEPTAEPDGADVALAATPVELPIPMAVLGEAPPASAAALHLPGPVRPARLRAALTRLASLAR